MSDVTRILSQIEHGDQEAAQRLFPLVYDELRKMAAAKLARENPGQTLQATALVHEAYLRLAGSEAPGWTSRTHFFGAAAEAMRRILVDQARRKSAVKRGGEFARNQLDEALISVAGPDEEVIAIHEALDQLAAEDPAAAELVKMHYFGGFSMDEATELLGMSRATGYRLWTYARAWLRTLLEDGSLPD
jgi:RNA polymerase sigma factor (TIGR02999 family)